MVVQQTLHTHTNKQTNCVLFGLFKVYHAPFKQKLAHGPWTGLHRVIVHTIDCNWILQLNTTTL